MRDIILGDPNRVPTPDNPRDIMLRALDLLTAKLMGGKLSVAAMSAARQLITSWSGGTRKARQEVRTRVLEQRPEDLNEEEYKHGCDLGEELMAEAKRQLIDERRALS